MRNCVLIIITSLFLMSCEASEPTEILRVASFNVAMGMAEQGQLSKALARSDDARLLQLAEILHRVQPDIVLLNEFDYDPGTDAAALLNKNYLHKPYPHHFRAAVNTGLDSGLDLDGDGSTGGPGDAWGFGHFPGQYGMLVLSRYPVIAGKSRTFQNFPWSSLPAARRPLNADGSPFYSDETWRLLRLSSKSHWDVVIELDGRELHLLAHHPTPPVFDGPENRNSLRNFDEIRFWREYTGPGDVSFIIDDQGRSGGLESAAGFVIAGDFNADPHDGDSEPGAIDQLLNADWINGQCIPVSKGGQTAAENQAGINRRHRGNPAADTADFNDQRTGNLRLDYVLPSANLQVTGCGVFWPAEGEDGADLVQMSDHRLVWLDIAF